ncbi:MAG TPA: hypothetical protein VGK74_28055 [Symbiobacteriaceae bacterium]
MGLALGEPHEDDVALEEQGARIYLAKQVTEWYAGAELGWETDNWGGGFTFNHPSLGSCG